MCEPSSYLDGDLYIFYKFEVPWPSLCILLKKTEKIRMRMAGGSVVYLLAIFLAFIIHFTCCNGDGGESSKPICVDKEREALLTFKRSVKFDPPLLYSFRPNNLSSWVGEDCCRWSGVSCNNITGNVMTLDLNDAGLSASELNPSLSELTELQHLDLSFNNFMGSKIPEFVGSFKELRYLYLFVASFTGVIPHTLGNLSNLEELYIGGGGVIPSYPGGDDMLEAKNLDWLSSLSNLQYLEMHRVNLSYTPNLQRVLSSSPSLSALRLANCGLREFPLPSSSVNLSSLSLLELSHNTIHGQFPPALQNLTFLRYLHLHDNNFSGKLPHWLGRFETLSYLSLSNNSFSGTIPKTLGNLSNLVDLDLSYNGFSGTILETLGNLSNLVNLDLSYNGFSGHIDWLPKLQNLTTTNLAHNSFNGFIPSSLTALVFLNTLYLNNNKFNGTIPINIAYLSDLDTLFLSNNNIDGEIPSSLCKMKNLMYLDLSNNHLSGSLPRHCWTNSIGIQTISLANNTLTGSISGSFAHLPSLFSLHLSNNRFSGELPFQLSTSNSLRVFDLSINAFSGNIPKWIGRLSNLTHLNLRSNNFSGTLISELCHLTHLRVLDISQNKFSGVIPPCFKSFDAMKIDSTTSEDDSLEANRLDGESLSQLIKGIMLEYTTTLRFLVNLDLSSNDLVGEIPEELTSLIGLTSLNLSNNYLSGGIPKKIDSLTKLESLDLSNNHLSHTIPPSITNLSFIGKLNLSYNNLSGRIPSGSQMQTFDSSCFQGNPQLCGLPLEKNCLQRDSPQATDDGVVKNQGEPRDIEFYMGMVVGFVVGFCGVCSVLLYKKNWRNTCFQFLENMYEFLVVKVIICVSQLKEKYNF